MPEIKLQPTKILTDAEAKSIDKTISDLKDARDGVELMQGVNIEAKNKPEIDKKIDDLERVRRNHSLPQLSPTERDRAKNELQMLEDDLHKDMPTWREYAGLVPKDGARYTALVKKIVQWDADPIRRQKVNRWKILRRLVDPQDPQAANMMYLFPQ